MKLDPYLTSYTKINSKWIKDSSIRSETKIIKEKLFDSGLGNNFFGYHNQTHTQRQQNKQLGLNQTKKLLHSKRNNQPTKREKICANHYFING